MPALVRRIGPLRIAAGVILAASASASAAADDGKPKLNRRAFAIEIATVVSAERGRLPLPKANGGTPPHRVAEYRLYGRDVPPGISIEENLDDPTIGYVIKQSIGDGAGWNHDVLNAKFREAAGRAPRSIVLPIDLHTLMVDADGQGGSIGRRIHVEAGPKTQKLILDRLEARRRASEAAEAAQRAREVQERLDRERRRADAAAAEEAERQRKDEKQAADARREAAERLAGQTALAIRPPGLGEAAAAMLRTLGYGFPIILGAVLIARSRESRRLGAINETGWVRRFIWTSLAAAAGITVLAGFAPLVRVGGSLAFYGVMPPMNPVFVVLAGGLGTLAYLVFVISLGIAAIPTERSRGTLVAQTFAAAVLILPPLVYFRFFDWR